MALTEWFTDNYTRYGATLEFVSDRSQEGSQFVKGFGGVGALLRFQLDVSTLDYEEEYTPLSWPGSRRGASGPCNRKKIRLFFLFLFMFILLFFFLVRGLTL